NPTSFCKCICGANSTIIPLDAPSESLHARSSFPLSNSNLDDIPFLRRREEDSPPAPVAKGEGEGKEKGKEAEEKGGNDNDKGKASEDEEGGGKKKEYRKKTCNDCNKQYCLNQGLHICEGKALEDVFTTCFRMFFPTLPPPLSHAGSICPAH
ncbi:MAG: hypothetical protein Q9169_007437, partial [Polycauliona sp. 2 TL-2023]